MKVAIAVPTGALLPGGLRMLARARLARLSAVELGRKLLVDRATLRVILVRPADVPAYVDHGAADLIIIARQGARGTLRHRQGQRSPRTVVVAAAK